MLDIHPGALLAAHVARCAAEQGAFWPMHARLFKGQQAREWGDGSQADFKTFLGYAADLNLDMAMLEACVAANRYATPIEHDYNDAVQLGVRSTPTFLINGELFVGAQPYQTWKRKLDYVLAQGT